MNKHFKSIMLMNVIILFIIFVIFKIVNNDSSKNNKHTYSHINSISSSNSSVKSSGSSSSSSYNSNPTYNVNPSQISYKAYFEDSSNTFKKNLKIVFTNNDNKSINYIEFTAYLKDSNGNTIKTINDVQDTSHTITRSICTGETSVYCNCMDSSLASKIKTIYIAINSVKRVSER